MNLFKERVSQDGVMVRGLWSASGGRCRKGGNFELLTFLFIPLRFPGISDILNIEFVWAYERSGRVWTKRGPNYDEGEETAAYRDGIF